MAADTHLVERPRLLRQLAAAADAPVWLTGPAGAGKSVLLRSYVEKRKQPAVWIVVPRTDGTQPVLAEAIHAAVASHCGRRPPPAPLVATADAATRKAWLKSLANLPQPDAAIVIDDAHRIESEADRTLLHDWVEVCRAKRRILIASRRPPGSDRDGSLADLPWLPIGGEQMMFDAGEAQALAQSMGATAQSAEYWHSRTGGWPAGLALSMSICADSANAAAARRADKAVAHAVQEAVLAATPPAVLAALAVLGGAPSIPAEIARHGEPWRAAVDALDALAEAGAFVERDARGGFRLREPLIRALSTGAADPQLAAAAIDALIDCGAALSALACAVAHCHDRVPALVQAHGTTLLCDSAAAGLAEAWSRRAGVVESPWLGLWCARALLARSLRCADELAERVFAAAVGADAHCVRLLCAVGMLARAGMTDTGGVSRWARCWEDVAADPGDTEEVLGLGAIMLAAIVGRPDAAGAESRRRAAGSLQVALAAAMQPPDEALLSASALLVYLQTVGEKDRIEPTIAIVEAAPWFGPTHAAVRADWYNAKGQCINGMGLTEAARKAFEAALASALDADARSAALEALVCLIRLALRRNELDNAGRRIEQAESFAIDASHALRAIVLHLRGLLEFKRGFGLRALGCFDAADALVAASGAPPLPATARDRMHVLSALGRVDDALKVAAAVEASFAGADRDLLTATALLLRSLAQWEDRPEQAQADLARGLELAQRIRWTNFLSLLPEAAGMVADRALRLNIAVPLVREAIAARALPAPPTASLDWPWPLSVRLLGDFRLLRDGVPMAFSGKVQRKPLELLKLLASAPELSLDQASICDALWPDAAAPAARRSFDMAVARLRELLGEDAWVLVAEGRARLESTQVGVDLQLLWRLSAQAERLAHQPRPSVDALRQVSADLAAIYQGEPLANEEPAPWVIAARDRYRGAFVRGARALARALEAAGHGTQATTVLERSWALEPLAEELAQMLMRLYIRQQQPSEAQRVFRQLRQTLSILTGRAPATLSEQLGRAAAEVSAHTIVLRGSS